MASELAVAAGTQPVPAQPNIEHQNKLLSWINAKNIAADLDDNLLGKIGQRVKEEYAIDDNSRSEWREKTDKAIDLAAQNAKEKQYPWPKAANVIFPLMTTAAVQFAARAYPAIISGKEVVKGIVIGKDDGTPAMGPNGQPVMQPGPPGPNGQPQPVPVWQVPPGAKQIRADNLGEHMSWQLLDEMPEWEPETDQLLHMLPTLGCVFRKTYFDPGKRRNVSQMSSPINIIVNYHAKSLETAPRITEEIRLYPLEIKEMELSGAFLPYNYGAAQESGSDEDAPHVFLEQHRWWDLDDDGYPEPYIVTIHKSMAKVCRIVARYDAEGIQFNAVTHKINRIDPVHYYTKYDFLPNVDGGIYGMGFGQLLAPLNEAVNTSINQMLDAGHLQNAGGGFIGKGLSMQAGAMRFQLGEYKTVNVAGGTLRENLVPFPAPGPSAVLFQLLGLLIEAGREVAAIKDILTGDQKQSNVPASTTLALIEQGLKVFTAIYKRIHRSLKSELAKIYRLNRIYMNDTAQYKVGDEWKQITKDEYTKGSGVEPISDPTMVSDMQRLGRAQFLMQFKDDAMFDGMEIRRRMLDAAQITNIDRLLHPPTPNPVIAIKGMEMEHKHNVLTAKMRRDMSAELKDLTQAILNLASADVAVGDQHLGWLNHQLDVLKVQYEAIGNAGDSGTDGQGPPGPGNISAGLRPMAPPPSIAPAPAIPPGQGGIPVPAGNGAMA